MPLATRTPLLKGCWFLGSKTQEQQNLCTGDTDNQNALLPCICQLINLHVPTPETQSASHVSEDTAGSPKLISQRNTELQTAKVYTRRERRIRENRQGGSGVWQVYETSVYYFADWWQSGENHFLVGGMRWDSTQ